MVLPVDIPRVCHRKSCGTSNPGDLAGGVPAYRVTACGVDPDRPRMLQVEPDVVSGGDRG